METLRAVRAGYDSVTDTLFASFGDYDLTCLDHEEEVSDGVFLQYAWPSGDLAGMEIWGFRSRYGSLPATIQIGDDPDMEILVPEDGKVSV